MGALAYPEFEFAIEHSDPEIGERELIGSSAWQPARGRGNLSSDPSSHP